MSVHQEMLLIFGDVRLMWMINLPLKKTREIIGECIKTIAEVMTQSLMNRRKEKTSKGMKRFRMWKVIQLEHSFKGLLRT
jgi:hypothetical protein